MLQCAQVNAKTRAAGPRVKVPAAQRSLLPVQAMCCFHKLPLPVGATSCSQKSPLVVGNGQLPSEVAAAGGDDVLHLR